MSGAKLTIVMIAHRMTTIECAENLLFFQSSSEIISSKKGSQLYSEILEKLKAISYAYGEDSSSDEDLDLGVGNFELN